jgi:CBS domain-containing protein
MRAHQIMTRSVITVMPDATILEAANTMLRRHVSGLPVVDAAGKLSVSSRRAIFIRRSEIGTQRKRGRWLKFLLGAGATANRLRSGTLAARSRRHDQGSALHHRERNARGNRGHRWRPTASSACR